jgi:hypothetical protein
VIPLSVGPLRNFTHQGEPVFICDVVFNPKLMARVDQGDLELRYAIIELALLYCEEDHKCKLSRQYKEIDIKESRYIGNQPAPQVTEAGKYILK